jgi:type IV secretory pathway VirB10-like protein
MNDHSAADRRSDNADTGALLQEPPRLTRIRMPTGPGRGLNKRSIVILAAGGGLTLLLIFASTLSPSPAAPAKAEPIGAIRPIGPQNAARRIRGPETYADLTEEITLPPEEEALMTTAASDDNWMSLDETDWSSGNDETRPASGGQRHVIPHRSQVDELAGGPTNKDEPTQTSSPPPPDLFFTLRPPAPPPLSALTPAPPTSTVRRLAAGTIIQATLITSVHSGLTGPVMAQVLTPVLDSRTADQVAIPAGTRMIGEMRAAARFGERRLEIIWTRLILPDASEVALDALGLDAAGRAGLPARTDNHWSDLFTAALLGTVISVGAAAADEAIREEVTLADGQIALRGRSAGGALAQGVSATASTASTRVLDRSLGLAPTLSTETGARISIVVSRTLEF